MTISELTSEILSIRPKMLGFAVKLTGNVEDAEDILSEAIYKALKNTHNYDERQKFESWFGSIVRNTYIDNYRKIRSQSAHVEVEDYHAVSESTPDYLVIYEETISAIQKIKFGNLLIMWAEGYKYEELAEMFRLPIGTVKSKIFFVRKKLKLAV